MHTNITMCQCIEFAMHRVNECYQSRLHSFHLESVLEIDAIVQMISTGMGQRVVRIRCIQPFMKQSLNTSFSAKTARLANL